LTPDKIYPLSMATTDALYSQWSSFSMNTIGIVPSQPDAGSDLWTTFLRSRYGVLTTLNAAYRSTYSSFENVPFPSTLPRQPQPLLDWYQFQGMLLMQAAAHRFTVYLPMSIGDAQNTEAQRAKADLAQRVVLDEESELERVDGRAIRRAPGAGLFQQRERGCGRSGQRKEPVLWNIIGQFSVKGIGGLRGCCANRDRHDWPSGCFASGSDWPRRRCAPAAG
jgi:hypothetical protein